MVQKFPEKVWEIRETVEFPKCEPLNRHFWKFSRAKLHGKKTSWKIFRKFGYTTRGCPLLWKFMKMLLYSQLEVPENSTTGVLWNEKRPIFPFEIGSVFEFWNLPISLNLVPRSHSVFSPLAVGDLGTRLNFTLTRRWKINTENFLDANKKTVSTFW